MKENIDSGAGQDIESDQALVTPEIPPVPYKFMLIFLLSTLCSTGCILIAVHLHDAYQANYLEAGTTDWPTIIWGALGFIFGITALGTGANTVDSLWKRWRNVATLRSATLPERAKHAAEVLQEATKLVQELQSELDARTALLEDVRRQAAEANERATDMEKLSHVDEETTQILNKYFDEALKNRLATLEQDARRREWLLGTAGALAFGILAILFAHYLFGF